MRFKSGAPLGWLVVSDNLLAGPLENQHRELGASFAEFGGWLMPVSYAGTVSEHNATRNAVGLFDVCLLYTSPSPRDRS